ncbi:MAG TPA: DUF4321 domain-containing protein [Firmicutes bacterium]|jgi:hypothetical protein|nr:DUF4321 domain-containing protein [Bacillota bacterium]
MAKVQKSMGILIVLLIIGSVFGTFIGEMFKDILPFLNYSQSIGLKPATLDLAAITVTLGITLNLNIATIIGFFIALFIYSRL